MDSLGVFYEVPVKNGNELMEAFDEAFNQTNSMMEKMDSFGTKKYRAKDLANNFPQADEDKELKNFYSLRNNNNLKKRNTKRNFNFKKKKQQSFTPFFPRIESNEKNYQKEYENELISEIEQLFNPMKNRNEDTEKGMLSFLSPIIKSITNNIPDKNKKFYEGIIDKNQNQNFNKNKNMSKKNSLRVKPEQEKVKSDDNNDEEEDKSEYNMDEFNYYKKKYGYDNSNESFRNSKSIRSNSLNTKAKLSGKAFQRNSNSVFNKTLSKKNFYESKTKYGGFTKNKYITQYELDELKKNRYFNRTKTNFKIVAKNKGSKTDESNIDHIIKQLKHHYG